MKKKGLIISTVVMVVVLIASLTTATYAWFTATSQTSIGDLTLTVGAGSDVRIGVKTDNKYVAGATEDAFMSDAVDFSGPTTLAAGSTGTWANGTPGLGPNLTLGKSDFAVTMGVGTAATINATTADANWNTANKVIKAEGSKGSTTIKNTEAAVANTDYIDMLLGVAAAADGQYTKLTCNITINPADNKVTIGMNAAIHVRYRIGDGEWHEEDIYGTANNGTKKTDINATTTSDIITGGALADGWKRFSFDVKTADGGTTLAANDINQLHLIIFIAGYDNDCNDNATGVSASISIDFTATKKA